jgi:hypothetical protein
MVLRRLFLPLVAIHGRDDSKCVTGGGPALVPEPSTAGDPDAPDGLDPPPALAPPRPASGPLAPPEVLPVLPAAPTTALAVEVAVFTAAVTPPTTGEGAGAVGTGEDTVGVGSGVVGTGRGTVGTATVTVGIGTGAVTVGTVGTARGSATAWPARTPMPTQTSAAAAGFISGQHIWARFGCGAADGSVKILGWWRVSSGITTRC